MAVPLVVARPSAKDIERLQAEVSLQRLAETRGAKLRPRGKWLLGVCPLHNRGDHELRVDPKANLDGIAGNTTVILCQSMVDALTVWSAGYRNVTASHGPDGFTDEHLLLFRSVGITSVVIAFHRTPEVDHLALELAERLNAEGFDTHRVVFPQGMDANDFGCAAADPTLAFRDVLAAVHWLGKGRRVAPNVEPEKPVIAEDAQVVSEPVPTEPTRLSESADTTPVSLPPAPMPEVLGIAAHARTTRADRGRNGPEFSGRALDMWCHERRREASLHPTGQARRECLIESFNGRFSDECLNQHWFLSLQGARRLIAEWLVNYNEARPPQVA